MTSAEPSSAAQADSARISIVGLGASAGGLRALQSFFDHVPVDTGKAFVVIVHLDPNHSSQMAELLQSHTKMPVEQATRTTLVRANHVYVIPPDKNLALTDGHLKLSGRGTERGVRVPIDLFFRTLAETHDEDATGIVLSGTGQDGSRGLGWIRERGGVTMAQAPEEAEFDSMPRSAIATGHVDVIGPITELAQEVGRVGNGDGRRLSGEDERVVANDAATVAKILAHVRSKTEHDFSGYKRSTVLRRLARRMQFRRVDSPQEYLRSLRNDPDEVSALFNDLLITVTGFFRDPEAFAALEREVIPKLFKESSPQDGIRVWVAGCATGEEAYSLAILLCEHAETVDDAPRMQIFATDVHERAFSFARDGLFGESIEADVTPARLERFFSKEAGGYRVKKSVREKVLFATHDLLSDPPFMKLGLISCRNLLIYLDRHVQRRILETFDYALKPAGHLFLGSSESVAEAAEFYATVDKKWRIFRSLGVPHLLASSMASDPSPGQLPKPDPTTRGASRVTGELHRQLLEAYAPPSLVVGANDDVLHLSDGVGRYLQVGGGEPTKKLTDLLRADFRASLRGPIRKALTKGEPSKLSLRLDLEGKPALVDVTIRPLRADDPGGNVALVIFEEHREGSSTAPIAPDTSNVASDGNSSIARLEQELREVRTLIQANVEEHEATIEELRAVNEELQSINEEQKATSEELETSKEELQSTNEELRSINQEHQLKNEQLAVLNADLQNLIDSTDIGTIFLDRDLRIRRFTPAIAQIFNLLGADLGRPISHVTHALDYHDLVADAREVLRTLVRREKEVSAEDGRWFVVRLTPYRSQSDSIDGVVLTVIESTFRKTAEIDRESLLDQAQAGSAAKSDFIGVMSHEFRTPLNAILGYASILEAGAVGPVSLEQSQHLRRIVSSADHLAHMIDNVLTAARSDAGVLQVVGLETVELHPLLLDAVAMFQPLAVARSLGLLAEVPDTLPNIVSDSTRVRQILFNLLANAVRFTDEGQVILRARAEAQRVVIEVEDTGTGIAQKNLERIFDRFWQADQSRTRQRGGTGLGLAVSKALAQSLGGDIQVRSEVGKGSLFSVHLPYVRESITD